MHTYIYKKVRECDSCLFLFAGRFLCHDTRFDLHHDLELAAIYVYVHVYIHIYRHTYIYKKVSKYNSCLISSAGRVLAEGAPFGFHYCTTRG